MRIAANERLILDYRPFLSVSVIIAGDRPRPDIDPFPHGRVAQIRQMIRLGPGTQFRIFQFDEIADFGLFSQHRTGTKVRKRPDRGMVLQDRTLHQGTVRDGDGLPNHAVRHPGMGSNDAFGPDCRSTFQRHARVEHGVRADRDRIIDKRRPGIEHGHTRLQPSRPDTLPHHLFDKGEMLPGIDPDTFRGVGGLHARHTTSFGHGQAHDIGQVILSLRIMSVNPGQCLETETTCRPRRFRRSLRGWRARPAWHPAPPPP